MCGLDGNYAKSGIVRHRWRNSRTHSSAGGERSCARQSTIIRDAARALDRKDVNATAYCAMAKLNATEDCFQVVDQALQLHGGYGYLQDFPIERHLRDLRVHRILEGTNEVMRMIISRTMLKE